MSELPELLRGAIAFEYQDVIGAAWMAAKKAPKKKAPPKKQAPKERSHSVRPCDSCEICGDTVGGITCNRLCETGDSCDCPGTKKKKQKAFQPAAPGWSAPPPLPPA